MSVYPIPVFKVNRQPQAQIYRARKKTGRTQSPGVDWTGREVLPANGKLCDAVYSNSEAGVTSPVVRSTVAETPGVVILL